MKIKKLYTEEEIKKKYGVIENTRRYQNNIFDLRKTADSNHISKYSKFHYWIPVDTMLGKRYYPYIESLKRSTMNILLSRNPYKI